MWATSNESYAWPPLATVSPPPKGFAAPPSRHRQSGLCPYDVASLQRALGRRYGGIVADGVLGVETRRAIERFEQEQHLPVDGVVDCEVLRRLGLR